MFDFPSSPALGATYTSGGVSYAWDGQAWNGGPSVSTDTSAAMLAQLSSRENILYNGDFTFSSKSGYAVTGVSGAYFADGWFMSMTPANGTVQALGRGAGYSTVQRGRYRCQIKCTTAKPTLAATDAFALVHHIEGYDISPLGWGSASCIGAVLRFGFRGPAGTYCASILDDTATNFWTAPFTITAGQANQDTVQVFAIPPPPVTGAWKSDNTKAMSLRICLAAGSTYTGAVPAGGAWGLANIVSPTGGFNFLSSTSNVVEIFDVKLVGDSDNLRVDPGFWPTDFASEFARCQRYYTAALACTGVGYSPAASGTLYFPVSIPVSMRTAAVTVTVRTAGTYANGSGANFGLSTGQTGIFNFLSVAAGMAGAYTWVFDLDAQMT